MKQKKPILILAGVLVVLAAVYAGLHIYNSKAQEKETKKAKDEQIYVIKEEKLQKFSYTSADGGGSMAFTKKEGAWQYDKDPEILLDQDSAEALAQSIGVCAAVRELDHPDDWSDYGLEDAAYTISVTAEKGSEKTVYIGQAAGDNYYAAVKDGEQVYTVAGTLIESLVYDISSLAQKDTVPSIGSGNLKKVEVTEAGETKTYDSEDDLAELAGGFGTLMLTDIADYHMEEADAAKYGLDESSRITAKAQYKDTATDKKKSFTLYVGKADDSGESRYVTVKGSAIVYLVAKDTVANAIAI